MTDPRITPDYVTIFFDEQDPSNRGWAYNVIIDGDHTSGGLDLDAAPDMGKRQVYDALVEECPTIAIPDYADFRAVPGGWEAGAAEVSR